jgi:hypothetical protein
MSTIEQTSGDQAPGQLGAGEVATTGATGHEVAHVAGDTHTGVANAKLGMWLFLASDCLFFGAFIATYLLYRGRPGQAGPTPQDVYNIPFTSVTSFVLLMSSLTMVLALAAIQRGDYRRFRVWIMATALFGATFIGGQIFEFTEFTRKGLNVDTNLFGSSSPASTARTSSSASSGSSRCGAWACRIVSARVTPNASRSPGSTGTSSTWCGS